MKMRREQMDAFTEAAVKRFEDRMVVHLNKFFPEQCEALGEPQTRAAIREGIERAARYEIVSERDVCKYIDLMFAFGRKFDENREHAWAQRILHDNTLGSPTAKINRLYDAAMRHARQAAGLDRKGGA